LYAAAAAAARPLGALLDNFATCNDLLEPLSEPCMLLLPLLLHQASWCAAGQRCQRLGLQHGQVA
jgi:hypothetical protein